MRNAVMITALAVLVSNLAGVSSAKMAKSSSYEFEYSSVGLGGGTSQAVSYSLVSKMSDMGDALKSSSASYSIEPLVGGTTSGAAAAVEDWSLYD